MSTSSGPDSHERLRLAVAREYAIKQDPWNASLDDLGWLSDRIIQRLRRPDTETYWSDPGVQAWVDNPDYGITRDNDKDYLDFVLKLLPARASIEGAQIQSNTNRKLVFATWCLVIATLAVALTTIWVFNPG